MEIATDGDRETVTETEKERQRQTETENENKEAHGCAMTSHLLVERVRKVPEPPA